jgi:hypothetical protein
VDLAQADHLLHGLYHAVSDRVAVVCHYCAGAFGVEQAVEACGTPFLGEYDGHPSFRKLLTAGYQVITF